LDGANVNELTASVATSAMPVLGQTYARDQLKESLIQLTEGNTWWGEVPASLGDVSLHVDYVTTGPNVSGTLSGSLARGSGGSDSGIQICIFF
jgi:hypothetical protein